VLQGEEDESSEAVLKAVQRKAFIRKRSVMKAVAEERKDLESGDVSSSQEEGFLENVRTNLLYFLKLLSF